MAALKPLNPSKLPLSFRCSSTPLRSSSSSSSSSSVVAGGSKLVKRAYDALLLDAGGTLLQLTKPVEETYTSIGRKYGLTANPAEIKHGFKRAFAAPWPQKLRYQGDGRPFWKLVVSEATGCSNDDYFEEVYEYYANGEAWHLPDGAYDTLSSLKEVGGHNHHIPPFFLSLIRKSANLVLVRLCYLPDKMNRITVKMAVVSNFDTRLRKLLRDLNVVDLFDALVISSEVGYEKPDPKIFRAALDQLNIEAGKTVHVGDDEKADKEGANVIGIDCWLWGKDVRTFSSIKSRILICE